jgi:hypothetical protein
MTFYIVPLVEGHTEVGCIERLLHRVWNELLTPTTRLQVLPASRGKRDALINPENTDFPQKIEEAYAKLARQLHRDPSSRGLLLLLLDAEGDCPAELAPTLLQAATTVRSDAPIACVLAKRMVENWIVAGASTLAGVNGLPDPIPPRDQLEERSGVAWLEVQIRSTNRARKYKKTADAEPFVRKRNLQECRDNSPSFDKLCRELEARISQPQPAPEPGDESPPTGSPATTEAEVIPPAEAPSAEEAHDE